MKFNTDPKKKEKIKFMLWVEVETLERLDRIRPEKLTRQECIRQILKDYLDTAELGALVSNNLAHRGPSS